MESSGCTFIRMALYFSSPRPSGFFPLRWPVTAGARLPVLLAALVLIGFPAQSPARKAKTLQKATLVEVASYIPCIDGCSRFTDPANAFCFRLDDEYLVGEGKSYLHDAKFAGMEDFAGKQLPIRFDKRHLWISPPDRSTFKIERGSLFENFKDRGCVREVHKPILAMAHAAKRPAGVPAGAFPVPGSGMGDFQPLFLWYKCSTDAAAATVACNRWYRNGEPDGMDWYCARTADGKPLEPGFLLDPVLSQVGRLVTKSGELLQHDSRERIGNQLARPSEACR